MFGPYGWKYFRELFRNVINYFVRLCRVFLQNLKYIILTLNGILTHISSHMVSQACVT